MTMLTRRAVVTGGTVAAGLAWRKPALAAPLALTVLRPPKPAPALHWRDAAGARQSLAAYRGQGVVLNLWATWCAPCVAEMPALAHLAARLHGHGVVVLPVSLDQGGARAVRAFFAAHRIVGLPVLLDPDGGAVAALEVQGVPATFVISRTGQIVAWTEGSQDWAAKGVAARIMRLAGAG